MLLMSSYCAGKERVKQEEEKGSGHQAVESKWQMVSGE